MTDTFKDYREAAILLDDDVWTKHIVVDHPEMTKELIAEVLKVPSVVCESQHKNLENYRLYYKGPWKNKRDKDRYYRVTVKICNDGNWISTAHTRSSISCGEILFKEGEQ